MFGAESASASDSLVKLADFLNGVIRPAVMSPGSPVGRFRSRLCVNPCPPFKPYVFPGCQFRCKLVEPCKLFRGCRALLAAILPLPGHVITNLAQPGFQSTSCRTDKLFSLGGVLDILFRLVIDRVYQFLECRPDFLPDA